MFSPEYIKLCTQPEVAEKLREEWEPTTGDWCWDGIARHLVTGVRRTGDVVEITFMTSPWVRWFPPRNYIPLFQPRQWIEILVEKKGYVLLDGPWSDGYNVGISDEPTVDPEDCKWSNGPDPACALLRAWLEVVKEE